MSYNLQTEFGSGFHLADSSLFVMGIQNTFRGRCKRSRFYPQHPNIWVCLTFLKDKRKEKRGGLALLVRNDVSSKLQIWNRLSRDEK